jgi:hypothetical protein
MTKSLVSAVARCPVCGSGSVADLLRVSGVPVHCNVLWPDRSSALCAPRGDIRLNACAGCSHVYNSAFRPELMRYSPEYENSLHFSREFQSYASGLADRLVERYSLYDKDLVEIGCGKGEFLTLLASRGGSRGVGFDPGAPEDLSTGGVRFIRGFYSQDYAAWPVDLICCRHVLEHIADPVDFLTGIRNIIGDRQNVAVFFEVPNALYTLRDLGIWDIIYEHCSYFTPSSLCALFGRCGFVVQFCAAAYGDQFLQIEAMPDPGWQTAWDGFAGWRDAGRLAISKI